MNLEEGLAWRDTFAVISISLIVEVLGENKITQTRCRREEVQDLTLRNPQQFWTSQRRRAGKECVSQRTKKDGIMGARSWDCLWKKGMLY